MNIGSVTCRHTFGAALAVAALMLPGGAGAATISGGAFTMNLDAAALASFAGGNNTLGSRGRYLEEFLDYSYNEQAVTGTSPDPHPGTGGAADSYVGSIPSTTGLQFVVNGYDPVNSVSGRYLQSSSLDFTGSPSSGTGQIGLSGLLRFRTDQATWYLTSGDFSLKHNGSDWTLHGHSAFGESNFANLVNVTSSVTGNLWTMSGDLTVGNSWASFFGTTTGAPLGTFSFQTTVVPVPAAVWLFGSALLGLTGIARRKLPATV